MHLSPINAGWVMVDRMWYESQWASTCYIVVRGPETSPPDWTLPSRKPWSRKVITKFVYNKKTNEFRWPDPKKENAMGNRDGTRADWDDFEDWIPLFWETGGDL